ncbi:ParB/Srx family N-terminal domain-containing protein [Burkholderia cenocepacia]|uniref:ParB/RepB/Spo0J family partition protein n=1 Tax=Burkholderia cenocepacia TaxID=95486 RepID=UPI002AB7CD38|nr:ParB/Srx family N-terminal domain-containing protein [Burkholderia cenocepacia]
MNQVADAILANPVPYTFGKINYIPLGQLCVSPRNVRKKPAKNIPQLAADIACNGLLQNLVGHPIDEEGQRSGLRPFGICAGQGRLGGLDILKAKGTWSDTDLVPVLIVSAGEALAISLAENVKREGMHIADQCVAFRELIAEGRSIADIGARLSVSDAVVRRALKLANISSKLLEVFRDDRMDYEQACALALSDDHDQQERIWFEAAQAWQRSPREIRAVITKAEVNAATDSLAVFIGLEAYEAAGGHVRRDLFSGDGNGGFVADLELLNRLAVEKITAVADEVRAEGWAWVESAVRREALAVMRVRQLAPEQREFTKKEKAEHRKLEQAFEQADAALDAHYDAEESEADGDALEQAAREARAAVAEFEERRDVWTDEQKATAGALVWIDGNGRIEIRRGVVKPQESAGTGAGMQSTEPVGKPAKARPVHSETLCERLTAHRTAAVQAELVKRPDVAMAYLLYKMIPDVFEEQFEDHWRDYHALEASFRPSLDRLSRVADDMADSPAWRILDAERAKWTSIMPNELRHLLPWLMEAGDDVKSGLFAFCVAATVNGISRENEPHAVNTLADVLAVDMVRYWKPTQASYLNHVSKQRIVDVMSQAVSATAATPLASMKKGDAAAAAEMQMVETGWLPEVLTNRDSTFPIEHPTRETDEIGESEAE